MIDRVTSVNLSDKAQEITRPSVSYPSFLKSSFLWINPEDVNVEIILHNPLLKGSLSEIWTMQSNCVNLPSGKWKQFSRIEFIDWLFKFKLCFPVFWIHVSIMHWNKIFNTVRLSNCLITFCILYCYLMQKSKHFKCHIVKL